MNRREIERILTAIKASRAAGERVALATVVRVRGSAYRREGARILVRSDGSYECLLSGGCLEPAVADAAARVIATGLPSVARYDLEEDSVWSLGIGCSGAVDILIERVEDDSITRAWMSALEAAAPAVLVTALAGTTGRLLVADDGVLGSLAAGERLDRQAVMRARGRLGERYAQSGSEEIASVEVFYDVSTPPPELVIFGAGYDAAPLAGDAWSLGLTVTVVDVREAFLTSERFPHATRVAAHSSEFGNRLLLTRRSHAVIMNHHLERDREALRFALASEAPYIGVLGPRTRYDKLLRALGDEGVRPDAASLSRVRSPVGLALGAETPEEIAVSVLGEILALERGFDAGFLSGRTAGLHRSGSSSALARS